MAKLTIDIGARIDRLKKGLAGSANAVKAWGKKTKATIDQTLKTPKTIKPKIDTSGINRKIKKTNSLWSQFRRGMTKPIGLTSMAAGLGAIAAGLAAVVVKSVKLAASFEQTRIAFNTMLGDSAKGGAMLDELIEFSKKTPFTPEQTMKAGKTLLAFGFEAKDVTKTMRLLGDVSAGTGKDLSELAVIFGQIKGAGRLMGQDLLQLINAGFNPLNIIAEKTGKSMLELRSDMEKGLISFAQVDDAFKSATSEGGLFFNLMEKQSKSLGGRLSTLKGAVEQLAIGFGGSLMPVIKPLTEEMIQLAGAAAELADAEKSAAKEGAAMKILFGEWLKIVTMASDGGGDLIDFALGLDEIGDHAANTAEEIKKAADAIERVNKAARDGRHRGDMGPFVSADPSKDLLKDFDEAGLAESVSLGISDVIGDFGAVLQDVAKPDDSHNQERMARLRAIESQDLSDMQEQAGKLQATIGASFQPGGEIQSRLASIGGERTIDIDRQVPQKQLDQLIKLNQSIKLVEKRIAQMDPSMQFPG